MCLTKILESRSDDKGLKPRTKKRLQKYLVVMVRSKSSLARPEATADASRSKMQSVSDSGMTTFLYSMTCALRSLFDHLHSRLDK